MVFFLQLFLEGVEGMLLRDSEVAEPARWGGVVWIRNTRGHGTSTGSLLGVGHGNDDEEEGDNEGATGSGEVRRESPFARWPIATCQPKRSPQKMLHLLHSSGCAIKTPSKYLYK